MKLPELFEDRMKELLKDEYEDYLMCFEEKHYSGLRVNTLKITSEEFEKICPFKIERIPWVENGYYYDADNEQPARHPYYYAGLYYIQEPSAMTPANLLPISPGDRVLDLCAAPGGKSTELAAKLKGEGILVANDISNSRAKALLKNIELYGVKNAVVLSEDSAKLVNYFEGYFDKILIDAPCSGEGMFRKSPAIMKNWEQNGVDYYSNLQKEIILQAAKMLKPGGKMLYSTCTFSKEENEGTIAFLLEECKDFRILNPLELKGKQNNVSYTGFDFGRPELADGLEAVNNSIRLWPHKIHGEGHFICLLEKEVSPNNSKFNKEMYPFDKDIRKKLSSEAISFLDSLKIDIDYNRMELREDRLYLLPEGLPRLKGLRIMRQGLLLGEMKKNRFEPSQALACVLKAEEYMKLIEFKENNSDVIKYLKCETIQACSEFEDGYHLVCVDSHPLGWGKLSGTTLKNKYFPGWRWM
jgi:NOL1/NOP2/sun family putative RNA methylase